MALYAVPFYPNLILWNDKILFVFILKSPEKTTDNSKVGEKLR
jgi:hypothetical protein